MRTYLAPIGMLCLVVGAGMVLADAADRFKGANYDGYDRAGFYQTKPFDPEFVNARFRGAAGDGYDRSILVGTPVRIPTGMLIMMH